MMDVAKVLRLQTYGHIYMQCIEHLVHAGGCDDFLDGVLLIFDLWALGLPGLCEHGACMVCSPASASRIRPRL